MTEIKPVVRRRPGAIFFCLMMLAILSCLSTSVTAKTTVDFDPSIDFSKFKTFAYIGGVENLVSIQMNPDLINIRFHRMVVRELEKKGLHEVNPGQNPDLIVRYWANPETQVDVAVMGNWGPYGPYIGNEWGIVYNAVSSSSHHLGTLILDLIDPKAKALVWRVYLVRKMSDPDKDPKKAEDEFTDSFKNFPPSDKEKDEKRQERARESQSKKAA
ncbi:MAG TPA: DUF4136 domain-containing protein [Candidatus Acidoferrum sp.]|nr:DUF4136 domain-containing protein [Candidatus Acidoferrum sp.]